MSSEPTSDEPGVLGALRVDGGIGIVTVPIQVDADVSEVWSAITDPSGLSQWVGHVDGALRAGGSFRAHFFPSEWEGTGTVTACEAPHRWCVSTTQDGETDALQIDATVTAETRGGSTVRFVHSGMDAAMLAGYAAGLQVRAENLARYLGGREVIGLDRFRVLFALYKDVSVEGKPTNIDR
ncbi:MAG TPA: SRPBCC domain-containing protein [Galbitalea sp.]